MKKIIFILLSLTLLFACVSCNSQQASYQPEQPEQKRIQLTKENISQYISITDRVTECSIEKEQENLFGSLVNSYDDSIAEAEIVIDKKSANYSFENLTIRLILRTYYVEDTYPWKFKTGGYFNNDKESYDKSITCTIPYHGSYTHKEKFTLDLVQSYFLSDPFDFRGVSVEIVDVSGTVIIDN